MDATTVTNAAHDLLGRTLVSGWKVTEKVNRADNASGSFFSVCYKVEKGEEQCFLKAFDFAKFFQISDDPDKGVMDVMKDMIDAYTYERNLSNMCKEKHVTKVVYVKDSGEENVVGHSIPIVPYLIFDLAEGDLRSKIDFSNNLDFAWRLSSLHSVAVGLKQLHQIEVSHQDLKPSNVLLFKEGTTKLGDIGRALCKELDAPHSKMNYAGDFTYAPPEIMYGYHEKDWHKRVFATDCYLLGSMVVFYFSGISMTALLSKHIPNNFHWTRWRGPFNDVEPYLMAAYSEALNEFVDCVPYDTFKDELRWLVEKLCFPNPEERGHPRNIELNGNQFDMERFVTKLDVLTKKAEYSVLNP
ncbi:MAG: protein kinase domain-containing protein [Bacteroidia bacterium]